MSWYTSSQPFWPSEFSFSKRTTPGTIYSAASSRLNIYTDTLLHQNILDKKSEPHPAYYTKEQITNSSFKHGAID